MNGCITPNNRNSQQWGHSVLAWQVVVRSQPTETFSSTLFIKDFLRKSVLILDLLDVWILFWVSLLYYFYSFVLSLFSVKHPTHLFFSSHPGFLSICALWSLCSSQSFFQLPVSHTAAVSSLSSSLNPPSVCCLCDLARLPSDGCHMRDSCWHDTQVTPSDEQMSASEAIHPFFISHAHTHLHSGTHKDTHVGALRIQKRIRTFHTKLCIQHTQCAFPSSLTLSLSLSHTHTHKHTSFAPHIMPAVSETCSVFPLSARPHTRQKTSPHCLCSLQTKQERFSWTGQSFFVSLSYVSCYI